jgi:hypothetical protein
MIANFNQRIDAAASRAGMWNVRAQYDDAYRGSFVDRVCSFLEQYPLSRADEEDGASSASVRRIGIVNRVKAKVSGRPSKPHPA